MIRASTPSSRPGLRALGALALVCAALMAAPGCKKSETAAVESPPGHDFGPNDPAVVAVLGDSITAGYGGVRAWPQYLAELTGKRVLNFGRNYAASNAGVAQVAEVLATHLPGYLAVLYGTNDVLGGVPLATAVENLRVVVRAAVAAKSIPLLGLVTPLRKPEARHNAKVQSLNGLLREMARQEGVVVVDLYAIFESRPDYVRDGIHPTDAGSRAIAQAFAAAIAP